MNRRSRIERCRIERLTSKAAGNTLLPRKLVRGDWTLLSDAENVAVLHTVSVPNLYLTNLRRGRRSYCLPAHKRSVDTKAFGQLGSASIHQAIDQRRTLWKFQGELSSKPVSREA